MVTYGTRLLVIEILIDFSRSPEQIKQVRKIAWEYGNKKKNLDLPYELELLANDIEYSLMLVDNQSPISSSSL